MALMADDGLARAINPSHTVGDGDTVFALATGPLGRRRRTSPWSARSPRTCMAEADRPRRRDAPRAPAGCRRRAISALVPTQRPAAVECLHLTLLIVYSLGVVGARPLDAHGYVRTSSDFFVAGRSLGPGLDLRVDAGGQHRRRARPSAPPGSPTATASAPGGGVGSAGIGSFVFALWWRRGCGGWPRNTTSTPPATTSSSATGPRCAASPSALVGFGCAVRCSRRS